MERHILSNCTLISQRVSSSHFRNKYRLTLWTEWVTGDHGAIAEWDYGLTDDNIAYHKVHRQQQLPFSETRQQADWGNWYWATQNSNQLSFQSGSDTAVRGTFVSTGSLSNTKDTNYRPINQEWPTFGFSSDLGSVTVPVNTLYTLGLAQEQAIQFDGATGIVPLTSLWPSYFPNEKSALSFFYKDYAYIGTETSTFDHKVATDSIQAGGNDYNTITALSVRQSFGALQLVGNSTKPYLFLKEISSDGNTQTVDVIFPFQPILLYTNPSLLKLMLDPLFENQESGQYPNTYSMHDLGANYPNATGHHDGKDEPQPLEECGNMLIMTLAYAERTNDIDYLSQHYKILDQWTQYLIDEALIPADQISTDDFAGSLVNQTNLALKGIIGIEAMARIASVTGNTVQARNYTMIAHAYMEEWQNLGIAHDAQPPHTTLGYGRNETHGILYNLYADALLRLDLVPRSVYDMQSAFYPTVSYDFGIPLDTRHKYTKSDWEMFAAAVASDSTKNMMIHDLAKFIDQTHTSSPMTDLYDAETGNWPDGAGHFAARPVVGGHFALLALTHPAVRK